MRADAVIGLFTIVGRGNVERLERQPHAATLAEARAVIARAFGAASASTLLNVSFDEQLSAPLIRGAYASAGGGTDVNIASELSKMFGERVCFAGDALGADVGAHRRDVVSTDMLTCLCAFT